MSWSESKASGALIDRAVLMDMPSFLAMGAKVVGDFFIRMIGVGFLEFSG